MHQATFYVIFSRYPSGFDCTDNPNLLIGFWNEEDSPASTGFSVHFEQLDAADAAACE